MERRDFLKTATAATVGAAIPATAQTAQPSNAPVKRPESPDMIYRELGTTGERVSAIGMGGYHLGKQPEASQSIHLMHAGIDRGITEVRMGQALRNGYRQKVFLMTKMDGRTAVEYNKQLEQSLGRLQTDMIDLVQFHEIIRMEDPDRIFTPGGAIEGAVAARQAGQVRYIGFTGHKDPAVHLRMLETAQKHNFHFDTVQMPVNVMDAHFRSFTAQVMPVALKQGVGVLAMKTFGDSYILKSNTVQPIEALHYGLPLPVSVVITGIDNTQVLDQAFEAARTFQPLDQAKMNSLLARTATAASDGKFEL